MLSGERVREGEREDNENGISVWVSISQCIQKVLFSNWRRFLYVCPFSRFLVFFFFGFLLFQLCCCGTGITFPHHFLTPTQFFIYQTPNLLLCLYNSKHTRYAYVRTIWEVIIYFRQSLLFETHILHITTCISFLSSIILSNHVCHHSIIIIQDCCWLGTVQLVVQAWGSSLELYAYSNPIFCCIKIYYFSLFIMVS